MLRAAICVAMVIGVAARLVTAQASSADRRDPVFRTSTNLVLLDVSVADGKGRPVRNLDRGSFRIYEDGAEQEIASFTYEQRPVSWGLVLDRSGSMSGMMDEVYNAALHSIEAGTPQDETFILAFDDRIDMVQPFTTDHSRLARAIRDISAGGTTALYDAVRRGLLELRGGQQQKKVLIVVTDGEDNASRVRFEELLERAKRSEAQVYTIGMFSEVNPDFLDPSDSSDSRIKNQLDLLAESTGGLSYFPKSTRQCDRDCKDIAEQVSRQYTIGYYPKQAEWNGKWRTIQVKVPASPKYSVRTRGGYYAVGSPTDRVPPEGPVDNSKGSH